MANPIRVLLLETDASVRDMLAEVLRGKAFVPLLASDPDGATEIFDLQKEVLGVIVTCSMKGDHRLLEFIRHVRERGFTGPVVACSSRADYQDLMKRAGCDHVVDSKDRLHVYLKRLFEAAPSST